MAVKIFFCYAREDTQLVHKLHAQLKPLELRGLVEVWFDQQISAGTNWKQEITAQLDATEIILLMISPDFFTSNLCNWEMQHVLLRYGRGDSRLIPITLRHVYWQDGPLGDLQSLPKNGKPVVDRYWHSEDEALCEVVTGICEVAEKIPVRERKKRHSIAPLPSYSLETHAKASNTYYVYEDDPTNSAKIHFSHCSYCKNGYGTKGTRLNDNRWHGPFDTLQEAEKVAQRTGKKNVSKCKFCEKNMRP